jgi:uncharacterized protein involved in outer membrane biogenesis
MTVKRLVLLALGLLLAAGIVAPYLSADRFANRIRESLEAALGRRVEIGRAHFNLFRGPGFSVDDVVIHEDPSIGIEPLAYVSRLEARIDAGSLWKGRLEFSTLRLDDPSVNLAKVPGGAWNFEILGRWSGGMAASPASVFRMPSIQVRNGRLNFRFGDVKSAFYLTDADLDIAPPPGGAGNWELRFSGSPARTDRTAQGFGNLKGTVRWQAGSAPEPRVDADLVLEKSEIAEIVALVSGHDIGVHGMVASKAHLSGPVSDIRIAGRLQIADLHRWDLMRPQGQGWEVDYKGRLDLLAQQFEVETVSANAAPLPLEVRFRAFDYLSEPRWAAALTLRQFPAGPVVQVARHLGAPFPERLAVDGKIDGVVGYSRARGLQGKVALRDVVISEPESAPVRSTQAELVMGPGKIELLPATVRFDDKDAANVAGEYLLDAQQLDLRISTDGMTVADLRSSAARLFGVASIPMLDGVDAGDWKGSFEYQRQGDKPGEWTGDFQLRGARIALPGVAEPLQVASANVVVKGDRATMSRIRAKLGKVELQGDYRYVPGAARSHQLRLNIPELDAAELERLMMPALRRQGFLARALGFGHAELPDWLAARQLDGVLDIGAFSLAGIQVQSVRTRLIWDGVDVEAEDLQGRVENGVVRGSVSASLEKFPPAYRIDVGLQSADWSDGKADVTLTARTSGIGAELWRNLRGEGSVSARSITLNPDTSCQDFSGSYEFRVARGIPRLSFTGVQATLEDDSFSGRGSTQPDGRLQFDLSSGPRQLRVGGTLFPLQLGIIATR